MHESQRSAIFRRAFVGVLFALFALALLRLPGNPAAQNADRSFRQVYAHFIGTDAQAGTDHVFNLGPLGHFVVPVYDADLYWLDVSVATLLALCGAFPLTLIATRHRSRVLVVVAAVLAAMLTSRAGPEVGYLLAIVATTLLLLGDRAPPLWAHVAFGVVLGFLGVAKFTFLVLGSISVVFVFAAAISRRDARPAATAAGALLVSLVFFWLVAGQELAGLPAWIQGSLEISQAYNWGMTIEGDLAQIFLGLGAITFLLVCVALPAATRPLRARNLLVAAYIAFVLLLQWKHGVIRQNAHMSQLFVPIILLPLLLPPIADEPTRRRWWMRASATVAVVLAAWGHNAVQPTTALEELDKGLRRAVTRARNFVTPIQRRDVLEARRARLAREHALPRYQQLVGDATLDIFPPRQGIALLNGFNYHPRPVLQGYQAGTPGLLQRNADFYSGTSAPAFVLYRLAPLDGRFPAMEDGLALRALFSRYRPVAREGGMLLLARDPEPRVPARTSPVVTRTARFGKWVSLPEGGENWQLLRLDVRPTAWGQLRAAVYKPPPLRFSVRLDDGRTARHSASVGALSASFVLSPYLERGSTLQGWPGGPASQRVKAFLLDLPHGGRAAFDAEFSYEVTRVAPLTHGAGSPRDR